MCIHHWMVRRVFAWHTIRIYIHVIYSNIYFGRACTDGNTYPLKLQGLKELNHNHRRARSAHRSFWQQHRTWKNTGHGGRMLGYSEACTVRAPLFLASREQEDVGKSGKGRCCCCKKKTGFDILFVGPLHKRNLSSNVHIVCASIGTCGNQRLAVFQEWPHGGDDSRGLLHLCFEELKGRKARLFLYTTTRSHPRQPLCPCPANWKKQTNNSNGCLCVYCGILKCQ